MPNDRVLYPSKNFCKKNTMLLICITDEKTRNRVKSLRISASSAVGFKTLLKKQDVADLYYRGKEAKSGNISANLGALVSF